MARSIALGLLGQQSLGTHSYIMNGLNGRFSFSDGDIFEIGNGPFSRRRCCRLIGRIVSRPFSCATRLRKDDTKGED